MQQIYPITEKSCSALCNKPVLIFLNDGSEVYGVLSRVEKGKLILNDPSAALSNKATKKAAKKNVKIKIKPKKAKSQTLEPTQAPIDYLAFGIPPIGGFGYPQAMTFDMESVVALFA